MFSSFNFHGVLEGISEELTEGSKVSVRFVFRTDSTAGDCSDRKIILERVFNDSGDAFSFVSCLMVGIRYRVYATVRFDLNDDGSFVFQRFWLENIINAAGIEAFIPDEVEELRVEDEEEEELSKEEHLPVRRGGLRRSIFFQEFERRLGEIQTEDKKDGGKASKKSGIAAFAVLVGLMVLLTALLHG